MNRAEYDRLTRVYRGRMSPRIATRYALTDPAERYTLERREAAMRALLQRQGMHALNRMRILDLGCGRGRQLTDWVRWGARPEHLAGIDIMAEFARDARLAVPAASLAVAIGDQMPFPSRTFDIVAQMGVLTSILDPEARRETANEMLRVVKPGGLILWYDFRVSNPRNRDARGIGREALTQLFPGCTIDLHNITLAAPLARALGKSVFALGGWLEALPLLRTHYLGAIRAK